VLKYTPVQKLEMLFVGLLAGIKAVSYTATTLRVDAALTAAYGLPGLPINPCLPIRWMPPETRIGPGFMTLEIPHDTADRAARQTQSRWPGSRDLCDVFPFEQARCRTESGPEQR